jgi:hypothetical protein
VSRKSGRSGHRPKPQRRRPNTGEVTPLRHHHDTDPELIHTLRSALRSGHPIDFLDAISGFMEVADAGRRNAFAHEADRELPTLTMLVDSLIGISYAETTAALHAIHALTDDAILARRIGVELAQRRQPMPEWLTHLDRAKVEPEVWFMTHILGDGDDYFVGVELADGQHLTALVYVDHNLCTVVKDSFTIPSSLDDVIPTARASMDDPDQRLVTVDAADARATIERALVHGARIYPPLESDSWPMCRPLVEWMVRLLPSGGVLPEGHEWTDAERDEIAHAFLASPYGSRFDNDDDRHLLDNILWFGTDYGPGDPYRWSPVNVEIVLTDWFPRKIVATPAELAPLPDLLRAFVRFCHHERGIRSAHTAETLASIDRWEPDYQRLIRSARLQGPAALIAGLHPYGEYDLDDLDVSDDEHIAALVLTTLDRTVGGRVHLMALDTTPLPDEEFEWAGVPDDIRPVVAEILAECDRVAGDLLDVEHRTAIRRLLSRAAVGDPQAFRRRASTSRAAAAAAWIICSANATTGQYGVRGTLQSKDLLAAFGVTGSVSDRASTLLAALGLDHYLTAGSMELGAPDLLVSATRSSMIAVRDDYLGR